MKNKLSQKKEKIHSPKHSQVLSLNSSMINIANVGKNTVRNTHKFTMSQSNSLHMNLLPNKSKKTLITSKNKKEANIKQKDIATSSGRIKKTKTKKAQKKLCDFQNQKNIFQPNPGNISYREYCLVDDAFVPVQNELQQQKIEQIMRSTADSSCLNEDFNRSSFRKLIPFKLKQNSLPSCSQKQSSQISQMSRVRERKVSIKEVQIEAHPIYEQVGIQYSERPQFKKQKQSPVERLIKQIHIQTQQCHQNQNQQLKEKQLQSPVKKLEEKNQITSHKDESLSDLLLKLQFKHLPNQKSFQNLSKTQKQHYKDLLSSLICKLAVSPRIPEKQSLPTAVVKTKQKIQIQEAHFVPLEEIKVKYEKLQMQIYKRQCYQMNWMQKPFSASQNLNQQSIDTSLLAVTTFLFNFFCYLELNYADQFLIMIKKQYGPSYHAEYQKATRKIQSKNKSFKVLDVGLFQDFCDQALTQISIYQRTHLKAIFDCVNDLLDTYRPFYQHRGQPFPWSMKMYNNICEYAFDQNSLEIIFGQIKENLQNFASNLCGLIVEEKYFQDIKEVNPLNKKREERQKVYVDYWLNQKTGQSHQIQCESTKVLYEVSQQIYNDLLIEILMQKPLETMFQPFQFIE